MARTLAACLIPAFAISVSWLRIEDPRRLGEALAMVGLALAPAVFPAGRRRVLAVIAVSAGALWIAFGARPWELLPFRDERVVGPVASAGAHGISDFYGVVLPLEPDRNPEMHALVLCAIFGFTLGAVLLIAARRPIGAAAVTVAGAGWPATLIGNQTVQVGALALVGALSIPLILRARSRATFLAGAVTAAIVVSGAAWASSATTIARKAALNWEAWDIRSAPKKAASVRFAWESNYDGINFPATKTVVLTVEGPDRARYWRASTLDLFTDDRWFEDLFWSTRVDGRSDQIRSGRLTPPQAAQRENWIEQRIEVKALVDDHLAAAGTPVALDARRLGIIFVLSGGVLRARDTVNRGLSYRVWSYSPDPAPAALAVSRPRYPAAANRYLEIDGRRFPAFGTAERPSLVRALLSDPSYKAFTRHEPMYVAALHVAGRARSPYAAVLALESWFRQRGGFRYDESPPRVAGPPLSAFVTRTKAGYCQHFAGAMAAMLRMLGIPARVAVGFTSGTQDEDGKWVVTDHEAHAWVEVWFAGLGWIPFDPTPGRGTFAGEYSFASDSKAAVAALRRGELSGKAPGTDRLLPDSADLPIAGATVSDQAPSFFGIVVLLGVFWALGVGIGKAGVRRARYVTRDPRRVATASRRELEGFLRDQGVIIPRGGTLQALQRAVRDRLGLDGSAFAAAAARGRFGLPSDSERGASQARRELRSLLKRARKELSLWERFRGFVSVRSLRGGVSA